MTACNQGLLSLYKRELAREKELTNKNYKLIEALEKEIASLK